MSSLCRCLKAANYPEARSRKPEADLPMLRYFKPAIFLACLVPLALLVWNGFHQNLGANPIETITHSTGNCTLIFLLITLSITPLRKLTRQYWLIGLRRMFGLFAFFYGTLHLMTWVWPDKGFDVHDMLADVVKRRFITAGMTGFALMIPLALTSTKWAIRKMGGKRWQALHRLIYLSAIAGVIHYIWLVKADLKDPLEYAAVLAVLLLYRVGAWLVSRSQTKVERRGEASPLSASER
jgi:sulfoxide reductase heme-binding subunit YedZ